MGCRSDRVRETVAETTRPTGRAGRTLGLTLVNGLDQSVRLAHDEAMTSNSAPSAATEPVTAATAKQKTLDEHDWLRLPGYSGLATKGPRCDLDSFQNGLDAPYKVWEGDHTAFVHVLWSIRNHGLDLKNDSDEIASMVRGSRAMQAHVADQVARALREAADAEAAAGDVDAAARLRARADETTGRPA